MSTLEQRRQLVRESLRKRRVRLKADDMCVDCGKNDAETDRTLCFDCLLARSHREVARRARKRP
jgi:hypothetical protein